MSEDQWKDARDALNRFGEEEVELERAAATRRRAIASMERNARRSWSWRGVVVGVAVVVGGGLALAQVSGWGSGSGSGSGSGPASDSGSTSASAADSDSVADSVSDSVSDSISDPVADSVSDSVSDSDSDSPSHLKSPTTNETSLYRRAHTLQFSPTANSPNTASAALAAWDSYLHSYPHGLFAPEARYNRAIALIRLERLDAAVSALAPFACQPANGYRASEARSLIARIQRRAPQIPVAPCALPPEPTP